MRDPSDIFDGCREYESELELIISLLAPPSPGVLLCPFSVTGMDRLQSAASRLGTPLRGSNPKIR
jgi:hypothetical protein